MNQNNFVSYLMELLGLVVTIVLAYGKFMAKNRELELRIKYLEEKSNSRDQKDDRIFMKLDEITKELTNIRVELADKADR